MSILPLKYGEVVVLVSDIILKSHPDHLVAVHYWAGALLSRFSFWVSGKWRCVCSYNLHL